MRNRRRKPISPGVWFVLPVVLLLFVIIVFPIAHSIYLSLWESSAGKMHFVGLGNFADSFVDPDFWKATWVTFLLSFLTVCIDLFIGLTLAVLLNRSILGKRIWRTIMLTPWMIAPPIAAVLWQWVYDAQFGIGNGLLIALGIIREYQPWLGAINLAFPAVLVANVWKNFPFVALILLAGLQAIPGEQYEAATVDGASAIQKFFSITIPNLRSMIVIATTLDFIWNFRSFDLVFILTHGGPGTATQTLPILVYNKSIEFMRLGSASAVAVLMFVFMLSFSALYMRVSRPTEY